MHPALCVHVQFQSIVNQALLGWSTALCDMASMFHNGLYLSHYTGFALQSTHQSQSFPTTIVLVLFDSFTHCFSLHQEREKKKTLASADTSCCSAHLVLSGLESALAGVNCPGRSLEYTQHELHLPRPILLPCTKPCELQCYGATSFS